MKRCAERRRLCASHADHQRAPQDIHPSRRERREPWCIVLLTPASHDPMICRRTHMAELFRFPATPQPPPPKNELRATLLTVIGPTGGPLTGDAYNA